MQAHSSIKVSRINRIEVSRIKVSSMGLLAASRWITDTGTDKGTGKGKGKGKGKGLRHWSDRRWRQRDACSALIVQQSPSHRSRVRRRV